MYYKNYWVSYIDFGEEIVCCEMCRDMTNFVSTDKDPDYKYIKRPFEINRYEYEHARDYLDENGLFMGIFPPEVIEQDIKEWNEEQERFQEEQKEWKEKSYKRPLSDNCFKYYAEGYFTKEELVKAIASHNIESYNKNKLIFDFDTYYKDLLDKYNIKYTDNKEIGIWTGKNIL